MEKRKIIVTSNCQTAGLTVALSRMLPDDEIIPLPITDFNNEQKKIAAIKTVSSSDVWLHTLSSEVEKDVISQINSSQIKVIQIPAVSFNAFHPDLVYVLEKGTNKILKNDLGCDYHSALTYWAYSKSLDIKTTVELFNINTYKTLGYLNSWVNEFPKFERHISHYGINFDDLYQIVKSTGVFMHSVNHPKVVVMIEIARHYAKLLGASPEHGKIDLISSMPDVLEKLTVWPVYSEIAEAYGVQGSYKWKILSNNYFNSVDEYVQFAFKGYQGIDCDRYYVNNKDMSVFESLPISKEGL